MEVSDTPAEPTGPSLRTGRLAVVVGCLLVATCVILLVTVRFAPRFVWWQGLAIAGDLPAPTAEFDRAVPTLAQIEDPWAPINHPFHQVISWRLLFPVTWHYLHLPRSLFLVMPHIGCVLALWLTAGLTYTRLGRWGATFWTTVLFAATPWYFVSCGWLTLLDSWLILGLLVTAFVPSRSTLALSCLLTPWIDERFVLALPATLAVRAVALGTLEARNWRALAIDVAVAVAASAPYPLVRVIALVTGDGTSSSYVQLHRDEIFTIPWTRFADGFWSGYRAGWIVILALIPLTARRVGWPAAVALGGIVFGTAVGGLFVAWDMGRSMMMVSPALLLGVWLWEEFRVGLWRLVLPAVVLANLVLPAEHVLWSAKWPVETLWTETNRWRDPPRILAAVQLIQEARLLNDQGRYAEALKKYDEVIRTEGAYPQAYIERALLRMERNDPYGAAADVDEALRQLPNYPYGLLLRGVLRLNRGDAPGARADIQQALDLAPPDWPYREVAQGFLADAARKQSAR